MKNIGEIIRKHRKLKHLTQEELGTKLFVSKQAVSKWENGRTLPDLETTQKLISSQRKNRMCLNCFVKYDIILPREMTVHQKAPQYHPVMQRSA